MDASRLALKAAASALTQRQNGDERPLRQLFAGAFSLLRFLHHRWTGEPARDPSRPGARTSLDQGLIGARGAGAPAR